MSSKATKSSQDKPKKHTFSPVYKLLPYLGPQPVPKHHPHLVPATKINKSKSYLSFCYKNLVPATKMNKLKSYLSFCYKNLVPATKMNKSKSYLSFCYKNLAPATKMNKS